MPNRVVIRDLSRGEIEAVLQRNKVGRVAFSLHDRVDVEPIHYVYEHGWLYGRTSEGDKLAKIAHNQWVAFEVDEIRDTFEWTSVVIHGSFWIMQPEGTPRDIELWEKGINLVSKIIPGTFTESDPVPSRRTLFRIAINDSSGREARQIGGNGVSAGERSVSSL